MEFFRIKKNFFHDPLWHTIAETTNERRETVCGVVVLLYSFAHSVSTNGVLGSNISRSSISKLLGGVPSSIIDALFAHDIICEREGVTFVADFHLTIDAKSKPKSKAKPAHEQFQLVPFEHKNSDHFVAKTLWFSRFKEYAKHEYPHWDGRHAKALNNILSKYGIITTEKLINSFFKWPNKRVRDDGWKFCQGYTSFNEQIPTLMTDLYAWERHSETAEIEAHRKEALDRASHVAQFKRIQHEIDKQQITGGSDAIVGRLR